MTCEFTLDFSCLSNLSLIIQSAECLEVWEKSELGDNSTKRRIRHALTHSFLYSAIIICARLDHTTGYNNE